MDGEQLRGQEGSSLASLKNEKVCIQCMANVTLPPLRSEKNVLTTWGCYFLGLK